MDPHRSGPPPEPHPEDFTGWPSGWRAFLLAHGIPAESATWSTRYVHGLAAYRLYMQDRLPEALGAAQAGLAQGLDRGGAWIANLANTIAAELEARDSSRRLEHVPFIYELPQDGPRYDRLTDLANRCAAKVEQVLGFRRPATMFTLLAEGSLIRYTDSRYGYMAPKEPYFKICLPRPAPADLSRTDSALVHEYTHVAVHTLSDWHTPRWVNEGLAQWMEERVLDLETAGPLLPPGDHPHLGSVEARFHAHGDFGDFDPVRYAYDAALAAVRRLVAVHGEYDLRDFLARLAHESEGHAFGHTFGQSERRFEHEWHEQIEREADGR